MARSSELTSFAAALARLESAYQALDELPPSMRRMARQWAAEHYPEPTTADLAKQLRQTAASDETASHALINAALALADAVDGGSSGQS